MVYGGRPHDWNVETLQRTAFSLPSATFFSVDPHIHPYIVRTYHTVCVLRYQPSEPLGTRPCSLGFCKKEGGKSKGAEKKGAEEAEAEAEAEEEEEEQRNRQTDRQIDRQ